MIEFVAVDNWAFAPPAVASGRSLQSLLPFESIFIEIPSSLTSESLSETDIVELIAFKPRLSVSSSLDSL